MSGLIVLLKKGSDTVRVFPTGEVEWAKAYGSNWPFGKNVSQLLTIRRLELEGWELANPAFWDEAEA